MVGKCLRASFYVWNHLEVKLTYLYWAYITEGDWWCWESVRPEFLPCYQKCPACRGTHFVRYAREAQRFIIIVVIVDIVILSVTNANTEDNVYFVVVMTESLREFYTVYLMNVELCCAFQTVPDDLGCELPVGWHNLCPLWLLRQVAPSSVEIVK